MIKKGLIIQYRDMREYLPRLLSGQNIKMSNRLNERFYNFFVVRRSMDRKIYFASHKNREEFDKALKASGSLENMSTYYESDFEDYKTMTEFTFEFIDGPGIGMDEESFKKHLSMVDRGVKNFKNKLKIMTKTKAIEIETTRKNGKTVFKYEVAKEIEEFFKETSGDNKKESSNWPGTSFYVTRSLKEDKYYQEKLSNFHLFDDFGGKIISEDNRSFNIAWIRTVGGIGSIEFTDMIPMAVLTAHSKSIMEFLKEYFTDIFSETKIVGNISLEI